MGSSRLRKLMLGTLATLALTACTGTPASSPTAGGSTGAPGAALDTAPVIVGWNSTPDENYLPMLIAIDAMKQQGYKITAQQLASDSVALQGLVSNTIQFTGNSLVFLSEAVKQGATIKGIVTRNASEVAWVAAPGYEDCAKLNGKAVGIYSPSAEYTVLQNLYFDKKCPGVKPVFVTLPDSTLRAQALAQGQIFGSALGLPDALHLEAQNPNKFFVVNLADELPGIGDEYVDVNTQTLQGHPTIAKAFVAEQLKAIRSLYSNPSSASGNISKYLPGVTSDAVLQSFIKGKFWYANGGFAGPGLEGTLKGLSLSGDRASLLDSGPLDAALKDVGPSTLTQY